MALRGANGVQARFTRYIESIVSVIGHADRAGPLRDYCTGLIVSEARKSVEPMAAITAPDRTGAQHQSCCILSAKVLGRTSWFWPKFARWFCLRLSVTAR